MAQVVLDENTIKQAFKEALTETLQEQRDLLREIFVGVLEDMALSEAIRQGRETDMADRSEIAALLEAGS